MAGGPHHEGLVAARAALAAARDRLEADTTVVDTKDDEGEFGPIATVRAALRPKRSA